MLNVLPRLVLVRRPQPKITRIFLLVVRSISRCSIKFHEDHGESKGKLSVIKKKLTCDGTKAIQWKSAADVIRRLNWENKHLFGPVINSKPVINHIEEILKTNQIIQQETKIPIFDPNIQHENEGKYSKTCSNPKVIDLGSILTFPLKNKPIPSLDTVNKFNLLRKHLESLTENSIPSVSTILQKTMPVERVKILDMWKLNMIQKLGEEGFQRYQQALLSNGASLHNSISSFLSSTPVSELVIKEENIGHWKSLKTVLPYVKDVKLLEEFVTHPFLYYRGVVDCFAKYKNHLVVIDWKTSKKDKTNIKDVYDNPLQIAAYVGALNFDLKFQYLAQNGIIVVAYENGTSSTVHFIDQISMEKYWIEWLKRIKQFWEKEREQTYAI